MARKDPTEHKYYDRFDLLLAVSLVTVGLLLLVDLDQGEGFAELLSVTVTILTATMLMLAVSAAGVGRRGRRLAWIAVALTVSASVIGAFLPLGDVTRGGFLWLALVVAAPVLALVRLMHHKEIKAETLLGAVSVYLMMSIAGTYLFMFLDTLGGSSGEFFGSPQPTTVFMYFSLVTVTTVGYGDFAPVEVFGRAAAGWVAIIGQIYLVVVVAYVVAMFTSARTRKPESALADDD
ncbi:MAG: ion channel [Actinomycetia bacterium]|nr:ion channel [Actinomycetes bacterium]